MKALAMKNWSRLASGRIIGMMTPLKMTSQINSGKIKSHFAHIFRHRNGMSISVILNPDHKIYFWFNKGSKGGF